MPARTTPDLALTGLISLAAYRTARLITTDSLTAGLREQLWNRWPPNEQRARQRWNGERLAVRASGTVWPHPSPIGRLISCHWCMSAHAAAFWTLLATRRRTVPFPLLTFAAAAGAAGLLGAADRALA